MGEGEGVELEEEERSGVGRRRRSAGRRAKSGVEEEWSLRKRRGNSGVEVVKGVAFTSEKGGLSRCILPLRRKSELENSMAPYKVFVLATEDKASIEMLPLQDVHLEISTLFAAKP